MMQSLLTRGSLMRVGIPAGFIFACAVVLGWNAGDIMVPQPPPLPPTRWSLPRLRPEDPARDLAIVIAGRPWKRGNAAGTGAQPQMPVNPTPPSWRLAGIAKRSTESVALIAKGSAPTAPVDYLRIGDRLPDNSVIIALTPDSITTKGGKLPSARTMYRLFGAKE
jgi:hypothetical protein